MYLPEQRGAAIGGNLLPSNTEETAMTAALTIALVLSPWIAMIVIGQASLRREAALARRRQPLLIAAQRRLPAPRAHAA